MAAAGWGAAADMPMAATEASTLAAMTPASRELKDARWAPWRRGRTTGSSLPDDAGTTGIDDGMALGPPAMTVAAGDRNRPRLPRS